MRETPVVPLGPPLRVYSMDLRKVMYPPRVMEPLRATAQRNQDTPRPATPNAVGRQLPAFQPPNHKLALIKHLFGPYRGSHAFRKSHVYTAKSLRVKRLTGDLEDLYMTDVQDMIKSNAPTY